MSRAAQLIAANNASAEVEVDAEVIEMSPKPDDIPQEVWEIIQETGKLATERLHEIIANPRFMRYKAADQAKLIALAQNRAYGMPKTNNASTANRNRGGAGDVTASELRQLASRSALPEYKRVGNQRGALDDIEDATILPS